MKSTKPEPRSRASWSGWRGTPSQGKPMLRLEQLELFVTAVGDRLTQRLEFPQPPPPVTEPPAREFASGRDANLEAPVRGLLSSLGPAGLATGIRVEWSRRLR